MSAYVEDTIAAIATGAAPGAVSILRLSGRDAVPIAGRILRTRGGAPARLGPEGSHRAIHMRVERPADARVLDDVLVVPMLAPRSYTGEDVVEIHCHGGRVVSDLVLRASLAAGARAARPGEFTERAYLNGRLDLCQAEAVADVVTARSEAAVHAARRQLDGDLSARILDARAGMLDARALTEAHLDFPEEDLPAGAEAELSARTATILTQLEELAATYERGRLVRDGIRVVLAGRPNVGKSSLMNALLGRDRALVSATAGTTRDYLEEPLSVAGLPVLLCDTAGFREARDDVERAGVERTVARLEEADVVLFVADGSEALTAEDEELYRRLADRRVVGVRNKADLEAAWTTPEGPWRLPFVPISALRSEGLEDLARAIEAHLPTTTEGSDGLVVTSARHFECLRRAAEHVTRAVRILGGQGELELVAAELQQACQALDEIVGRSDIEDVLDRVFSRFCLGK